MTETIPAEPAPAAPTPPAPSKGRNVVGLVALGVAALAFLLAVIPPTSFIAWLPAIAAIVLAIVGLTRKNQTKGTSIAAIIIAPVAWIIAVVVALGTTVMAVDAAINSPETSSEATAEQPVEETPAEEAPVEEAPATAGIGTPVTSGSDVTYTVTSFACGIPQAGPDFSPEVAAGQCCEVKATVANGGSETFDMYTSNAKGFIDGAEYEANGVASRFGEDYFGTSINPGLTVEIVLYFDVPADKVLQTIEFGETFTFDEPVSIALS